MQVGVVVFGIRSPRIPVDFRYTVPIKAGRLSTESSTLRKLLRTGSDLQLSSLSFLAADECRRFGVSAQPQLSNLSDARWLLELYLRSIADCIDEFHCLSGCGLGWH
jgi:hypothetical protein